MKARGGAVASILAAASVACSDGGGGASPPSVHQVQLRLERVFAALPPFQQPVAMTQPPSDGARCLVVEQAGRVWAFDNNPLAITTSLFLDIAARVALRPETGPLGLAFHPAFPKDPRVWAGLKNGQEREAIRSATEILRAATHAMGMNAYRRYDIDVLESVPIDGYKMKSFVEQQWTRSVSRVQQLGSVGASSAHRSSLGK